MAKILPKQFRQLEYIESSGTQYIDTGWYPSSLPYTIDVKFTPLFSASGSLFGNQYSDVLLYHTSSGVFYIYTNGGNRGGFTTTFNSNITYNESFTFNHNNIIATGDVSEILNISPSIGLKSQTICINANHTSAGVLCDFGNYKYYSFKITDSENNIIVNFIPAKRISDSVIGMYDLVSKQFFTNSGTGTFTAGPVIDVDVDAYDELEYIQSSGTQYIDTNYYPDKTTSIDYIGMQLQSGEYDLFGTSDSNYAGKSFTIGGYGGGCFNYGTSRTVTGYTLELNVKHKYTLNGVGAYIDDVKIKNTSGYTFSDGRITRPLTLMATNWSSGITEYGRNKCYNVQLSESGTLVKNFIPVRRYSDSAIGMVDTLTDTFYANAGTGEFIPGPSVNGKLYSVKKKCFLTKQKENTIDTNGYSQDANWSTGTDGVWHVKAKFKINSFNDAHAYTTAFGADNGMFYGFAYNISTSTWHWNPHKPSYENLELSALSTNTWYEIDDTIDRSQTSLNFSGTINGASYIGSRQAQVSSPWYISNFNSSSSALGTYRALDGEIAYLDIWKDDVLIHSYRPVNSGFYDSVTKQTVTNANWAASQIEAECKTIKQSKLVINNPDYHHIDGYTPLDYIEGDGSAYLDTGFKANQNTSAEVEFTPKETPTNTGIALLFGSSGAWSNASYGFYKYATWYSNYNSDTTLSEVTIPVGTKAKLYKNKNLVYIDDTLVCTHTDATFQSTNNLLLGKISISNQYGSYVKFYSCKIWDNGTLVRNFIPMKRNSDNVLGMYDLCNYYNWNMKTGKYYNNIGQLVDGADSIYDETYIPVTSGMSIQIIGSAAQGTQIQGNLIEYDSNKNVLDYWNACDRTITLKANTAYIRISTELPYINTFRVQYTNTGEVIYHNPFYTNAGTGTFTAGNEIPRYNIYNIKKSHYFIGG